MTASTQSSRGAARMALLSLAIGSFGIGMTEFVSMGLLPDIAAAVLAERFDADPEGAIAQAGLLISLYALGVVLGAPTIAGYAARFPRHRVIVVLLAALCAASVFTVLAPNFELLALSRALSGLPHGAYFGMAALVASEIVGPQRRGKAIAIVMSGLTSANVIGVPLGTLLGQVLGWRAAYAAVVAVFGLAIVMCLKFVPAQAGSPAQSFLGSFRIFTIRQVWFTIAVGATGFAALFAVYSYISTLVTEVAGAPAWLVPLALMATGIGMVVGNILGGAFADKSMNATLVIGLSIVSFISVLIGVLAANPVLLMITLFLFGTASATAIPAIQLRLLSVSGDYQAVGAALNHSALNIGNALGAALGGAAIAAHWGFASPAWVAAVLAVVGLAIMLAAIGAAKHSEVALAS